jgi:hypothetical protein
MDGWSMVYISRRGEDRITTPDVKVKIKKRAG